MNTIEKFMGKVGEVLYRNAIKPNLSKNSGWLYAEADAEKYNIPDYSMYQAQSNLYRQLSWFQSAVSLTAQSCAIVPFNVKEMVGEKDKDIPNHDFERLLLKPNPLQSRFEFLDSVFSYYKINGNAYIWLNRMNENSPPIEMWIIPSHMILPEPDNQMYIKGYAFNAGNGMTIPLETWEVMHLKKFNPDNPFIGLSDVEAFAMSASEDLAKQKWSAELYGKHNGKIPSILAFTETYTSDQWDKMIKQVNGETKRNQIMMLQNVKQGGISLLQNAVSQKDMEYLESRKFTKEEIYSIVAPGLYSMLSESATEANSRTGKGIFTDFTLWPTLTLFAEKTTNNILPSYGENLKGEFDDIRYTDRTLELSEQAEYSKTHTIDEVRQKYYEDKKIGDERGEMLPVQITGQAVNLPEIASDIPEPAPSESLPNNQGDQLANQLFGNNTQVTEPNAPTDEQANMEMKAWERFAISHLGRKSRQFVCKVISPELQGLIRAELEGAKTTQDISQIFAKHSEYGGLLVELQSAVKLLRSEVD